MGHFHLFIIAMSLVWKLQDKKNTISQLIRLSGNLSRKKLHFTKTCLEQQTITHRLRKKKRRQESRRHLKEENHGKWYRRTKKSSARLGEEEETKRRSPYQKGEETRKKSSEEKERRPCPPFQKQRGEEETLEV